MPRPNIKLWSILLTSVLLLMVTTNDFSQNTSSQQKDSHGMMMGHGMMGHGSMRNMMINNPAGASDTTRSWTAPDSASKKKNPLAGIVKASQKTKELYGQDCAPCHGNSGKGDGPTADMLEPKPANLISKTVQKQSDGALFWKISTGKKDMPSFKKTLSEKQRWEIINYVRSLARANKK
jgi:mono/diheme cytochrome c family protein